MINMLLTWVGVRTDNLLRAKEAVMEARQMIEAKQATIEEQRIVSNLLRDANKKLIEEQDRCE